MYMVTVHGKYTIIWIIVKIYDRIDRLVINEDNKSLTQINLEVERNLNNKYVRNNTCLP